MTIAPLLRRSAPVRIDAVIALLLFVGCGLWSLAYWKRVTAIGQPYYYQIYFEPAVMIACGKGLVVARPQVPAMVAFLWRQTNEFSCDAIPRDAPLGTSDLFQLGSWRYLMLAVGWTWRLFGVSWRTLGPLFALLFATTAAALYALFRIGMGPALAAAAALAVSLSEYNRSYLLVLRDYTKAPFTLLLIVLIGALVARQQTRARVLTAAAAYGAILGIGYGFRPDFMGDVPPFFVALFLFLPGGLRRHIGLKLAAAAACIAAFFATGWPVVSTLDASRAGCQWHVVALGFARQFDGALGVEPAPYEASREYLDEWLYTEVTSYAARVHPGIGHIEFCAPAYGAATREYIADVVSHFPADIVVRAYASMLRVVELPFTRRPGSDDPSPDPHYEHYRMGLLLVAAAIAAAAAADVRYGVFLIFFVVYFCGLPGTQFDARHFFHLEFVPWWAAGFLVQGAIGWAAARGVGSTAAAPRLEILRAVGVLAAAAALLVLLLAAARAYQQRAARTLLASYEAAPREAIAFDASAGAAHGVRAAPHTDPETADFIAVDVDGSRCAPQTVVAFRYDEPRRAYSREFPIDAAARAPGLTQIYMPVYDDFSRLEVKDAAAGCIAGVSRIRDASRFGLLLEAELPPGWRRAPLYQRLTGTAAR